MIGNALGAYLKNASCLHRCKLLSYTLVDEPVTEFDKELERADLYLYFGSPALEVWTEYRLISFLDFVVGLGGAVGLILGMSMLSMAWILLDALARGGKMLMAKKQAQRSTQQAQLKRVAEII